jgi:hypothetical protein
MVYRTSRCGKCRCTTSSDLDGGRELRNPKHLISASDHQINTSSLPSFGIKHSSSVHLHASKEMFASRSRYRHRLRVEPNHRGPRRPIWYQATLQETRTTTLTKNLEHPGILFLSVNQKSAKYLKLVGEKRGPFRIAQS